MNRLDTSISSFAPKLLAAGKYAYRLRFDGPAGPCPEHEGIPVNVIRGEADGPTLLILAAVHGDEYEGVQTVIQLSRELEVQDIRGTLLLVPVVNQNAYAHGTRTSGVDGGNLARAFPGNPDGSYTERLAWHLDRGLLAHSDFLLDLHSGGSYYAMPPMIGYYHRLEHKASLRSWEAAQCFGMPIIWGHETVAPGRTVSAATERNIPWLYTEGYGGKRVRAEEQKLYREGALRLMQFLGMLSDPAAWIHTEADPIRYRLIGDGNLDKAVIAEHAGFFVPEVSLLDEVKQGDLIGCLYDDSGQRLQSIEADCDGIVMMLRAAPPTEKGDGLYTLAFRQ